MYSIKLTWPFQNETRGKRRVTSTLYRSMTTLVEFFSDHQKGWTICYIKHFFILQKWGTSKQVLRTVNWNLFLLCFCYDIEELRWNWRKGEREGSVYVSVEDKNIIKWGSKYNGHLNKGILLVLYSNGVLNTRLYLVWHSNTRPFVQILN